ncbi:ABC transporter permease [Clostridium sp. C105KSO13]|uniref:ABC transporter permease n=1 Tax=Clostridium sp. C105KSO13 TaxID=1776045 RepID=UPI0007407074|nr:ABC transporter permease [Clostridium sp. C105KSO13]CUX30813.1 Putative aliphatic sulfonates transport permease protein SsuC [Clostridium sp. C105KSO13]
MKKQTTERISAGYTWPAEIWPALTVLLLLTTWQAAGSSGIIPKFMLPTPVDVVKAFISDFPLLMSNAKVTLVEAFIGLGMGVAVGFVIAMLMDRFEKLYQAFYPLIVLTQTIPTVAIAPLLVLWFGYEMLPKVILIVITTFFPITVSLQNGFKSADKEMISLMRSMGASKIQVFRLVKFPGALGQFFASLRISASYAVVGAVISEWLGGFNGLGVYMTRVKKGFSFDKMFAVIFLISAISLALMGLVNLAQKKCMPWEERK